MLLVTALTPSNFLCSHLRDKGGAAASGGTAAADAQPTGAAGGRGLAAPTTARVLLRCESLFCSLLR